MAKPVKVAKITKTLTVQKSISGFLSNGDLTDLSSGWSSIKRRKFYS